MHIQTYMHLLIHVYKHADLIASIIVNHTLKSCHKTKTCTQWPFCHDDLQKFKLSIGMGKKGDLSNSECVTVVGARRDSLRISETADLMGIFQTTISRVYREWWGKEKISSE